jgi:hypothetical protein
MSFRKAININCKDCGTDSLEPGTWLQQVTLCHIKTCPFYDVRPKTSSPIPISVLSYYQPDLTLSQGLESK